MQIDERVTGKTRLIGVVGNPIEHSISPQLHNTISSYLGMDLVYVPFKVEGSDLETAVSGLKALNITGFNVTIPHKKDIMKYIDQNSKEALLMGAVNTVKNIRGRFYGYNTDAEGFVRSFKEEAGTGFKDMKVAVIGAGGASRAIAVKIAMEGACKIYMINRTASKASEIAELINNNIRAVAEYCSMEGGAADEMLESADIIINTTPAGMYPNIDGYPVGKPINFSSQQIVYDVVYNPAKTRFLIDAGKYGCKTINGLGMLLYQGISAYEIWTGVKVPEEFTRNMRKAFQDIFLS